MPLRQNYKELATTLNGIFIDFKIEKDKLTNIVANGGSSFGKMFKIFGKSIDESSTLISENLDDSCDELSLDDDIDDQNLLDPIPNYMENTRGDVFMNDIISFENEATCSDNIDAIVTAIIETILAKIFLQMKLTYPLIVPVCHHKSGVFHTC